MNIKDIVTYMAEDFLEVCPFIPKAALGGLIGTAAAMLLLLVLRKKWKLNRLAALYLVLFYGLFLLYVTVLGRAPNSDSHREISWAWYGTWFEPGHGKAYVIENCLMFVPFGFFGSIALPRKKAAWIIAIALLISIGMEYLQLKYHSGYCELSDVLQNTAGTAVGTLLALLFTWLVEGR